MGLGIFFAVLSSLCWAIGPLIATQPVRQLGSARFGRLRISIAFLFLLCASPFFGGWQWLTVGQVLALFGSGVIGIAIGELLIFESIKILGPRLGSLLYSLHTPFTLLLGFFIFEDLLRPVQFLGVVIVFIAIIASIFFRNTKSTQLEKLHGTLKAGILAGVAAALMQAFGAIIAKPALADLSNPLQAASIRAGFAALAYFVYTLFRGQLSDYFVAGPLFRQTALSAIISTAAGMTFFLLALAHTQAGLAALFSSLAPIFVLPIMAVFWREKVPVACCIAAVFVILGAFLVSKR